MYQSEPVAHLTFIIRVKELCQQFTHTHVSKTDSLIKSCSSSLTTELTGHSSAVSTGKRECECVCVCTPEVVQRRSLTGCGLTLLSSSSPSSPPVLL